MPTWVWNYSAQAESFNETVVSNSFAMTKASGLRQLIASEGKEKIEVILNIGEDFKGIV